MSAHNTHIKCLWCDMMIRKGLALCFDCERRADEMQAQLDAELAVERDYRRDRVEERRQADREWAEMQGGGRL